jgi:DNA-directed RNA polymerase subunit RPC12/RpoP
MGGNYTCIECGMEFEVLAPWKVKAIRAAECPGCGATVLPPPHQEVESPFSSVPFELSPVDETEHSERLQQTETLGRSQRAARWVVGGVGSLFALTCFLPAMTISDKRPPASGLECLIFGVATCFVWVPNPLLLYGSIALLHGRNSSGLVAGVLASFSSIPLFTNVAFGDLYWRMHAGYFFWQADIFAFTLAAVGMTKHYGPRPDLGTISSGSVKSHLVS